MPPILWTPLLDQLSSHFRAWIHLWLARCWYFGWSGPLSSWICSLANLPSTKSSPRWGVIFSAPGLLAWVLNLLISVLPCWISRLSFGPLLWQWVDWPLPLLPSIILLSVLLKLPLPGLVVVPLIGLLLWLLLPLPPLRSTTSWPLRSRLFLLTWQNWHRHFGVAHWIPRSVLIGLGLLVIGQGLCWRARFQSPVQVHPLDCLTPCTWSSEPLASHPLWSVQLERTTDLWLGTSTAILCPTDSHQWQRLRSTVQEPIFPTQLRSTNGELETKSFRLRVPRALHVGMAPRHSRSGRCYSFYGYGGFTTFRRSPTCFAKWCYSPGGFGRLCRSRCRYSAWSPSRLQCSRLSRRWPHFARRRSRGGSFGGGCVNGHSPCYGPLLRGRWSYSMFFGRSVLAAFPRAFAGDGASMVVGAGFNKGHILLRGRRVGPGDSHRSHRGRGGKGGGARRSRETFTCQEEQKG